MTQTINTVSHSVLVPLAPEAAFELFADARACSRRATEAAGTSVSRTAVLGPPVAEAHVAPVAFAAAGMAPDPRMEVRPRPAKATEVEVTFSAEDDGTRVTLKHRGFEVHGEAGAAMHDSVGSDGGWPSLLQMYRRAA
jgi:hypothetical protein